ncbi:MAG: paraquat-inducible protein A [Burkholderiales bacterium]|nr:paraquat-inducible protein A [Burkholderiales bacterium]
MSREQGSLVVCEQCAMAHRWRPLGHGSIARCVRCEAVLGRGHRMSLTTILALTITATVVFLIGISSDVLVLELRGVATATTLPGAISASWEEGQEIVAAATAITALIAPALFLVLRLYVLVPLAAGRVPRGFATCVRVLHQAGRWNMIEVFTIGALLSLVRLAGLADAVPGPGLFALGGVMVLFAAIESAGLKHLWWHVQ